MATPCNVVLIYFTSLPAFCVHALLSGFRRRIRLVCFLCVVVGDGDDDGVSLCSTGDGSVCGDDRLREITQSEGVLPAPVWSAHIRCVLGKNNTPYADLLSYVSERGVRV